jgi:hypothetical protein
MQMEGMDMLHLLDGIQDGSVIFVSDDDGEMHMEQEGGQKEGAEREDYEYEE